MLVSDTTSRDNENLDPVPLAPSELHPKLLVIQMAASWLQLRSASIFSEIKVSLWLKIKGLENLSSLLNSDLKMLVIACPVSHDGVHNLQDWTSEGA